MPTIMQQNKRDPWVIFTAVLVIILTFTFPWITNNVWVIFTTGAVLGILGLASLIYFVEFALRENDTMTRKKNRLLMIGLHIAFLGAMLLGRLAIALILDFPRVI